jgi:hypothetical protein
MHKDYTGLPMPNITRSTKAEATFKSRMENCNLQPISEKNCFSFSLAQKMVQRFLNERRLVTKPEPHIAEKMTREELAKELGIEPNKLSIFNSPTEYEKADPEVVLILTNLYCNTMWEERR